MVSMLMQNIKCILIEWQPNPINLEKNNMNFWDGVPVALLQMTLSYVNHDVSLI